VAECKECCGMGSWYGMAPHEHRVSSTPGGSLVTMTVLEPKEKWPENFDPDPETNGGCGVWTCTHCHGSGQEPPAQEPSGVGQNGNQQAKPDTAQAENGKA